MGEKVGIFSNDEGLVVPVAVAPIHSGAKASMNTDLSAHDARASSILTPCEEGNNYEEHR